jgi:HD-GYP domain-containing protein (c-di-GMP phosphodiesterase class II)
MLHDVGKVGVPISILEKPGPLDDDEWDVIKQHTLARPYHKVRTAQATLEVIAQGAGRQFDPGVVAAAQRVFR